MKKVSQVDGVEIDPGAPIVLYKEIEIAASPQTVWKLLAGIDEWPAWNQGVSSASLEGELRAGTRFVWKSGGSRIASQLVQVDGPREIAWTGRALGLSVIHVYRIEANDSATAVRTEESVRGPLARLLRGPIGKRMESALEESLGCLRAEAERRGRE